MEPIAKAECELTKGDRFWSWTVLKCPFCQRRHFHGGGPIDQAPNAGVRLAHCVDRSPGQYRLVKKEV